MFKQNEIESIFVAVFVFCVIEANKAILIANIKTLQIFTYVS